MLLLAACGGNDAPSLPTPFPTAPSTQLTAVSTTSPIDQEPTIAPPPSNTPLPTPTLQPVAINITPVDGDIVMGQDVMVRGRAILHPEQLVKVSLVTLNGRLLASSLAQMNELGWEAQLSVPNQVSGLAYLYATVHPDASSEEIVIVDRETVRLVLDVDNADRYLALYRPVGGETAVSSYNFFFDGVVYRPTGSLITISIWMDDCQTQVAEQSFVLNGSGYWQGFLQLPWNLEGDGCAVAHFGEPFTADWREAVTLITVLLPTDKEANGVTIGNPPPGRTYTPGQLVYLYGTAYTDDGFARVQGELENGRLATDNNIDVDERGYWEYSFRLPAEVEGQVAITVSTGEPDDERYAEARLLLPIGIEE